MPLPLRQHPNPNPNNSKKAKNHTNELRIPFLPADHTLGLRLLGTARVATALPQWSLQAVKDSQTRAPSLPCFLTKLLLRESYHNTHRVTKRNTATASSSRLLLVKTEKKSLFQVKLKTHLIFQRIPCHCETSYYLSTTTEFTTALGTIMRESQDKRRTVRKIPPSPRTQRAGTVLSCCSVTSQGRHHR